MNTRKSTGITFWYRNSFVRIVLKSETFTLLINHGVSGFKQVSLWLVFIDSLRMLILKKYAL